MNKKTYHISVVCSDTTTYSENTSANTKKEAEYFCNGVCAVYQKMGKNIYMRSVKLKKTL